MVAPLLYVADAVLRAKTIPLPSTGMSFAANRLPWVPAGRSALRTLVLLLLMILQHGLR
jgi:hypothetical protein